MNENTVKYYHQLVGLKVVALTVDDSNNDETFGLRFNDGATAWILCDPEGNGPGFLSIESKS